jgi:energy-converting hydrogenase A subunit M
MNYGMFTEYGNRVVDGVVIAAKQLNWSPEEVIDILKDISTVKGLHEAYDTAVVEYVYEAIFEENV